MENRVKYRINGSGNVEIKKDEFIKMTKTFRKAEKKLEECLHNKHMIDCVEKQLKCFNPLKCKMCVKNLGCILYNNYLLNNIDNCERWTND